MMTQQSFMRRMHSRLTREAHRAKRLILPSGGDRNRVRLKKLSGVHAGSKAVVIGMGPSLRTEDLDRLIGVSTFACNKIYLAFDKTQWRPSYYSICDVLVAQNNRDRILATDFGGALPIHSSVVKESLSQQHRALFYDYSGSIADWQPSTSAVMRGNLESGLFAYGYSVVIDQIQLAYAMGFTEVYFIGVDFSFSGGIPTGQGSASGDVLRSQGEINHFHPDYRKPGETWTVPRMQEQEHAFAFCRAAFERAGRKLFNASRKSALTVVEKIPFDSAFPPL
jgi:hypothetical protein